MIVRLIDEISRLIASASHRELALAALALAATCAWLSLAVRAWWSRVALRRRARVASRAEHDAEDLLLTRGFSVVARQPRTTWQLVVDGASVPVDVRADLLVTRGGRRFVAEVKSGPVASRIETAATRRQLLEYALAYDADGVLLVDMERNRVHEVSVPTIRSARPRERLRLAVVAVALTALTAVALAWLER